MIMQYHKLVITVAFALATAFTLSCSSDDSGDKSAPVPAISLSDGFSSSSGESSSSDASSSSAQVPKCGEVEYDPEARFCDSRDKKLYKFKTIGTQTWMAENLNYNATNSRCYGDNSGGDSQGNCAKYGRLYNWATAMGIKYQGVCPSGWHIPNNAEWYKLMNSVGGSSIAGRKLKSTRGWSNCGLGSSYSYQCEDTYGFSALPGGFGDSDDYFYGVGNFGIWWSASEYGSDDAYYRGIYYNYEYASYFNFDKSSLYSVRCLQD